MKKALKKLAKAILYILVIAIPTLIAIKYGRMNEAKHIEKSTVKNYDNLVKSRRIDKVASTKNEKKQEWLKEIYNTK